MLRELLIQNAAIIERQLISFTPGLNVLSGETGGGKSIVLHSIEFLLGAKPKPNFLRAGAAELEIQALFDLADIPASTMSELPEVAQQAELSISRSLGSNGRGKIYINGKLSTLSTLSEVAQRLISICGQHQHVRLLEPGYHLQLLDGFAANQELVHAYRQCFRDLRESLQKAETLLLCQKNAALRRAELEFLVSELEAASLTPGIRQKLDNEIRAASSAEDVLNSGQSFQQVLDAEDGLYSRFASAAGHLAQLAKYDSKFESLAIQWKSVRSSLDVVDSEIRRALDSVELEPERLEDLRAKLADIARLERKYRCDDVALLELLSNSKAELLAIGDHDGLEKLQKQVSALRQKAEKLAAELSARRKQFSKTLCSQVKQELKEVGMTAELSVVHDMVELNESGEDKIEFFLVANKGERALPLRQIASGGELSRIMLVLKKILRERSGVNVLVFDEVDSGVSGGVARAVGQKLQELAKQSQVLCITHLPQVASLADHHLLVEKLVGKRTTSSIRPLDTEERVKEIARMLAGYEITAASLESARELVSSKSVVNS